MAEMLVREQRSKKETEMVWVVSLAVILVLAVIGRAYTRKWRVISVIVLLVGSLLLLTGLGTWMVQRLQPGAKIGKDVERVLEAKLRNLDQSEEITKKYGRFQRLSDARMISVYPGFTPFDRFYFEATAHFDKGQTRVHCDFYKGESVSIGSLDMHESQGGHLIYCWATHPEYQGPKTYPVSGTVSLEGRLLEEGDIYFYPLDPNISADAGKIKAGQFAFRTKEGKKRVEIRASRVVPGKQTPMGGPMRVESLPPRYNAQTTLTAEVLVKGDNRFEFPLESDK